MQSGSIIMFDVIVSNESAFGWVILRRKDFHVKLTVKKVDQMQMITGSY